MELTLSAAGTYTLVIANGAYAGCDTGTSCTLTGSFSSSSTQITMEPGGFSFEYWGIMKDEITFNYSIQGNKMTLTMDHEGTRVTIVLQSAEAFSKRYSDYGAFGAGPAITRTRVHGVDMIALVVGGELMFR